MKSGDFNPEDWNISNRTTVIEVETPKDWKCERKECNVDYKHSHNTYADLFKKS